MSKAVDIKYISDEMLSRYLLFHYGREEDQLPFSFGPTGSLNFPVRCIEESLEFIPPNGYALDLGCAVGRFSFELSRYCKDVLGVDQSGPFIEAAKTLQRQEKIEYMVPEEGALFSKKVASLPKGLFPERVKFQCKDALDVLDEPQRFDIILAANLICRLHEPAYFLNNIHQIIKPKGVLIITSPYSWMEEFTKNENWLRGNSGLESLNEILDEYFDLKKIENIPFLMREHLRKYQWGVSQLSLWVKR